MKEKRGTSGLAWSGRAMLMGGVAILGFVWVQDQGVLGPNPADANPTRDKHAAVPARPKHKALLPDPSEPKHCSPAHAVRAGDHEALLEYIAAGTDISEINPANLVATISNGNVRTLRVLFEHGYPHHRYAGDTIGDLAIKYNQPEVVRLVREFAGPFDAPAEYVALALGDPVALAAALASRERARNFMHRDLDWWANELGQMHVLEQAQRP